MYKVINKGDNKIQCGKAFMRLGKSLKNLYFQNYQQKYTQIPEISWIAKLESKDIKNIGNLMSNRDVEDLGRIKQKIILNVIKKKYEKLE